MDNAVFSEEFYNVASGGNPTAGMSEEAEKERRRKLSEAVKGEKNYFYGKHIHGKEHPFYGRHHTDISKEKMRQAKLGGKAPTAKRIAVYDEQHNFVREFETQKAFKIFLGLSPNGSTDTLKKYIQEKRLYHGYYIEYI